ncbi:MAG: aldo/keto reductase [Clostridia bacterium]|nr:aldo/keto reductase [Clostridia bacterium]
MRYNEKRGMKISAFSLGTVQLGMNYGITGKTEKPSETYAYEILNSALSSGVNMLDTANNYGDSERVIGSWLRTLGEEKRPLIVTKIGPLDHSSPETLRADIRRQAERSLKTLGLDCVDVMMLHNFEDYIADPDTVIEEFRRIKREGKARLIATSAYSEHDYRAIAASGFEGVQIPLNVFDHGRINDGGIAALAEAGMQIYVRSVFLQGIVFMKPEELSPKMSFAAPALSKFLVLSEKFGMSPEVLAVSFVLSIPGVTSVVLGCQTPEQVSANAALIDKTRPLTEEEISELREAFSDIDKRVVDPRLWNKC